MNNIADLIKFPVQTAMRERSLILNDLYALYTSPQEKKLRAKANWVKYCSWCKEKRLPDSKTNQSFFRRSHHYIKEMPIKTIAILLARLSVTDLFYVLSVAKDKAHRQESVGQFIIGSIKPK